ncbi:MAG: hypothetical protein M0T77_13125 [Actinomycetota bacterium]|nr:hypothetical protein [Actinomycetota bacterium]
MGDWVWVPVVSGPLALYAAGFERWLLEQGFARSAVGNRLWQFAHLVVSLANTAEPLYLALHGANRPSHEGVIPLYDRAIALARQAGFTDILLRGDTEFSLTTEFDRWNADGVRFIFGYDAKANLIERAEGADDELYHELARRAERAIATAPRTRPANVKDQIVRQRAYKTIRTKSEDVVEFTYRPGKCKKDYRVIALRKNLSAERGENVLFDEFRFFFYITNDPDLSADEVTAEARQRCNQENLISQLKGQVRALHAPVNTLNAPAKSSRPPAPSAGGSSPTTHGSASSSACSTHSDGQLTLAPTPPTTRQPEPNPGSTSTTPKTGPSARSSDPNHAPRQQQRTQRPQQPATRPSTRSKHGQKASPTSRTLELDLGLIVLCEVRQKVYRHKSGVSDTRLIDLILGHVRPKLRKAGA